MPRFTTRRSSSQRRIGVALWLALALLWQVAAGVAQAMPVGAGGVFEVCSVDGPRLVDANGQPVDGAPSHHHECCQLPTPLLPPMALPQVLPLLAAPLQVIADAEPLPRAAALPSPPSRGPPVASC